MANGLTIDPGGQTVIVTAVSPTSHFYTDTGLSSAVTLPAIVTSQTAWYCAVAYAGIDYTLTITQPDGTTIWDKAIRVGSPTDTFIRPQPTASQVTADVGNLAQLGHFASTYYYVACQANAVGTLAAAQDTLYLVPFFVPHACSIDRIGAEVTTAGSAGTVVRVGVYADNGYSYPGALVLDAGTIDGTSQTVQAITLSPVTALSRGLYWFGAASQVHTSTLRTVTPYGGPPLSFITSPPTAGQLATGYYQSSVTGALPATFAHSGITNVGNPRVHFRVA